MGFYVFLPSSALFPGPSLSLYIVEDSITNASTLSISTFMRISTIAKFPNTNYPHLIIESDTPSSKLPNFSSSP